MTDETPRHSTITDAYVAELRSRFSTAAEHVRAAPDWPETQRRMATGTHPYVVAFERIARGWSREDVDAGLATVQGHTSAA